MGVSDDELVRAGPWPQGINNLAPEGRTPRNENGRPVALREADNVDLTAEGWPQRRRGRERRVPGVLVHSLWGAPSLPWGLYVDAGELTALYPGGQAEPLGVLVGDMPLSYDLINDRVYYTSRIACGCITLDLRRVPWAPEQPSGQPLLAAVDGFGLDPGQYQVAVTFTDAHGRESGTSLAGVIDVAAGQGIELTSLPAPADPAETPLVNVYCSSANGSVLYRYTTLQAGAAYAVISAAPPGRALQTTHLQPLPAGQIVRGGHGRQWVAVGSEIMWSEPLRYGLWNPARNRIRFGARVDLLEPIGAAGVLVAAGDRTYWLSGTDPKDFTQRIVRASGAVPGSVARVPGNVIGMQTTEQLPVWVARSGHFCAGLPDGSVHVMKDGQAVIDGADGAALLFRQQDGLQQIIAALRAPQANGLALRDRVVARVIYDERA